MLREILVTLLLASAASAGLLEMFRRSQTQEDQSMLPYDHSNFGAICSYGEAEAEEFCKQNAGQFIECVQYNDDEDPYWIPPAVAALFGKKQEPKAPTRLLLEPGRCLCPTDLVLGYIDGAVDNDTMAVVTELEYDLYDRECYIKKGQPCRIFNDPMVNETSIPRCIWTASCTAAENEDFGICSGAYKIVGSVVILLVTMTIAQLY